MWPTERAGAGGSAWFLVGGTLVEVAPDLRRAVAPVVLQVDDPDELAARCWDAGFSVRVHEGAAGGAALSVIDPFGRPVHLVTRAAAAPSRRAAGEQWR